MSLEHLIVKPATEGQAYEATLRDAAYWGARAGVAVDDYVQSSLVFREGAFARDGRFKIWVLAPKDDPDTTGFYASCQVFARDILTLRPGQKSPIPSFGHAITSVLVPPEYRGKGYAKRFMSLMHSALAPHRYPNPQKAPTVTEHPSTVSVLYSAVGDYYARCAPSEKESGWTVQKSYVTTWQLPRIQIPPETSPHAKLLSESDVAETLAVDDSKIPDDLLEIRKKDPTGTYFAFVPTAPLNEFSIILGKLLLGHTQGPSNPPWGAKIPRTGDFMTWVYFGLPDLQLIVTRLRTTADSFPVLLNEALRAARDAKCENIQIWNVPEHLWEVARATGGEIAERNEDLSALKWYGQKSDVKSDNAGIVWALDERYSWC